MAYSKAVILTAIKGSGGYVSVVAKRVGCSAQTIYNRRHADPDIEAAFFEEEVKQVDFVEGKLQQRIRDGSDTAIIFYLKTRGRQRGYIEQPLVRLDFGQLTDEQIERMRNGESYEAVCGAAVRGPLQGGD